MLRTGELYGTTEVLRVESMTATLKLSLREVFQKTFPHPANNHRCRSTLAHENTA